MARAACTKSHSNSLLYYFYVREGNMSVSSKRDGPNGQIDPLWDDLVKQLDGDSVANIIAFVEKTKRPGSLKNPVNHPSVQSFRQDIAMRDIKLYENVGAYRVSCFMGNAIHITIGALEDPSNTLADFYWNWTTVPNGVNIYKDVCSKETERVFYGVLAVILSHRTTIPIDVSTIRVRFQKPKFFNRNEDRIVKVMTLRNRVRDIFHSKKAETSLRTLRDSVASGGSLVHTGPRGLVHTGPRGLVHTGPRGGKYVMRGKSKVYV